MILQSENPIRMVRELKGAPLSILMVLSLVHQRVTQEYLERATGYTDKPVSQALAYMQEIGLADHTNAGWQLIEQMVRQLPLPLALDEEIPDDHQNDENADPEELSPTDKKNAGRNISDSLNYLSKKEEVVINNINTSSSNSLNLSNKDGKIPTSEEIQKVLDAAEVLFRRPVMGDPQDYANIDRLLSWITQAYMGSLERGKLKIQNPAGLVYWSFHQGKDRAPEKKYSESGFQDWHLPESFKRDSGQWDFEDKEFEDEEVSDE
jgi:hypothetical protein